MGIRFVYVPAPNDTKINDTPMKTVGDRELEHLSAFHTKEQALLDEKTNLARLMANIYSAREAYENIGEEVLAAGRAYQKAFKASYTAQRERMAIRKSLFAVVVISLLTLGWKLGATWQVYDKADEDGTGCREQWETFAKWFSWAGCALGLLIFACLVAASSRVLSITDHVCLPPDKADLNWAIATMFMMVLPAVCIFALPSLSIQRLECTRL